MTLFPTRPPLKLFIWEGDGISEAYHDDGTLVVLAHDVEEARRLMLDERAAREKAHAEWAHERDAFIDELGMEIGHDKARALWTKTGRGVEIWHRADKGLLAWPSDWWDGEPDSIQKDPTRIVEVDEPKWVVFNGGGYD